MPCKSPCEVHTARCCATGRCPPPPRGSGAPCGKLRSGGHAYYLEVAGGPAHDGIEAPGEWLGDRSQGFGLTGLVRAEQLEAVLGGTHPVTGEQLGRAHDRVTVAAYDLTFCAPKSVSLLHALGSDAVASEVRAAHVAAVEAGVDYVTDRAAAVRRPVDGVRLPLRADALALAGFVHRTSRALDPHLHTHVVVANLARAPDGAWSALDGRGLYAHAAAAGALFHVQLRHELTTRLGVRWEPLRAGRGDIEGIGLEPRRAFSQRAAAIAAHLTERGLTSHVAADIAAHATRPARRSDVGAQGLQEWWRARARAVGLTPGRVAAVMGRDPPPSIPELGDGRASFVERAIRERGRPVARRDVVRAWCETLPRGAPALAVTGAADRTLASLLGGAFEARHPEVRGVGEGRHDVQPERSRDVSGLDRRARAELARALAGRGMDAAIGSARDRVAGRDPGVDLGMGFG